jgi:hypothetical protein
VNGVNLLEMKVFLAVQQAIYCNSVTVLPNFYRWRIVLTCHKVQFHCLGLLEGTEEDREYPFGKHIDHPDFLKGIAESNFSQGVK